MTDAEADARRAHPSNQDPEKIKNLKKLSNSLEPIFAAVEAETAQKSNEEVLDQPYAVIHLLMTRDGAHRLVEVLRDGKSQRAFKFLLNMGQMIIHEIVEQSLFIPGEEDDET